MKEPERRSRHWDSHLTMAGLQNFGDEVTAVNQRYCQLQLSWWARAASAVGEYPSRSSSAQSVKELRNPCGTAGSSNRPIILFPHFSPHSGQAIVAWYGVLGKVQCLCISQIDTHSIQMRLIGTMWEAKVAERAGFEPARSLRPYAISSRARSSTPAPLRAGTIQSIIGLPRVCRKLSCGCEQDFTLTPTLSLKGEGEFKFRSGKPRE